MRKKINPFDYKKFEESLGDIPTKKDVVKSLKRINNIEWFKPQNSNKVKAKLVVDSIMKAFKMDFSCEITWNKLEKKEDWNFARDSTWDSARDYAWDSARYSEFEVVKDLMKGKGYDKNPWGELLKLWEMGLYPVGVLKDKKFHIYYIPLKNKGRKQ